MGNILERPVTDKLTERGETQSGCLVRWGVSSMQGYRPEMEDQHNCITSIPGLDGHMFLAVYDGHSGKQAAILSAELVFPTIQRQQKYKEYANASPEARDPALLGKAMEAAFIDTDADLRGKLALGGGGPSGRSSGTTAVAVFITPTHFICANAGDSRSCYCTTTQVIALSEDHKPCNESERNRIERAGGHVARGVMGMGPMRVDGDLAVSRGLGDFEYKNNTSLGPCDQKVSCQPDITIKGRSNQDQLLIIACDGIWDVMSNNECCEAIRALLREGEADMGNVVEELLDMCLEQGSKDNMSAIIVAFPKAVVGKGPGVAPRRQQRAAQAAAQERMQAGRR
jgi:protein phosphatase 1B